MHTVSTVERAYQLARSGACANVEDSRRTLRKEKHEAVEEHLRAPSLSKSLRELCITARAARA